MLDSQATAGTDKGPAAGTAAAAAAGTGASPAGKARRGRRAAAVAAGGGGGGGGGNDSDEDMEDADQGAAAGGARGESLLDCCWDACASGWTRAVVTPQPAAANTALCALTCIHNRSGRPKAAAGACFMLWA